MAKEQVTIKATKRLQELAKTAIEIQDAANIIAVAGLLKEVCKYWTHAAIEDGQQFCGSDMAAQNPVTATVINKLERVWAFVYRYGDAIGDIPGETPPRWQPARPGRASGDISLTLSPGRGDPQLTDFSVLKTP